MLNTYSEQGELLGIMGEPKEIEDAVPALVEM